MEVTVPWSERVIAVVGGDHREREIARQAAITGAAVRAYGFPWPAQGIAGVTPCRDPDEVLRDAHYGLLPIPGMAEDGSLYAPHAPGPIVIGREVLGRMAAGAHLILGTADHRLRAEAQAAGVGIVEYEQDRELMLRRGPTIVEGALQRIIELTEITIHGSTIGVVGQGTVGSLLTRTLVLLGAEVLVAARNPVQRAEAEVTGAEAVPLDQLPQHAHRLDMLLSTVPVPVVEKDVLDALPSGSLVMDLAAPPGGVDLDRAAELGHITSWARGLGARAPVTAGASQWDGIRKRIERIEGVA
ncbi:MAG: dipicolinate synthase subunit DpsA [bacterium]|nr:dipicolinate synthase subunit DpsA [bacterium]